MCLSMSVTIPVVSRVLEFSLDEYEYEYKSGARVVYVCLRVYSTSCG